MKISEAKYRTDSEIKNIIFDWGGVLTDLEYEACTRAFEEIGFRYDAAVPGPDHHDVFIALETGGISAGEFRKRIRELSKAGTTDHDIDHAWNLVLGDLPYERWRILESLKGNYRLFLLSNTNSIHVENYSRFLMAKYGTNGYFHFFDRTFFSFELGMLKPDPAIFNFVLKSEKLVPEETLFIDDVEANILAARKLGIGAYHLMPPETIADLFVGD